MTIVLATDGSKHAQRAEEAIGTLCAPATVHCVSVYSAVVPLTAASHPFLGGFIADQVEAAIEGEREAAEAATMNSINRLAERGIEALGHTLHGDPGSTIVEFAKKVNADLIVTGAKGKSGIETLLLGSVSHYLVTRSDRSVLVVR